MYLAAAVANASAAGTCPFGQGLVIDRVLSFCVEPRRGCSVSKLANAIAINSIAAGNSAGNAKCSSKGATHCIKALETSRPLSGIPATALACSRVTANSKASAYGTGTGSPDGRRLEDRWSIQVSRWFERRHQDVQPLVTLGATTVTSPVRIVFRKP